MTMKQTQSTHGTRCHSAQLRISKTFALLTLCICTAALRASESEDFSQLPSSPDTDIHIIRGSISYGANTPVIINRPGVYRLAGPLSATGNSTALTINANNVSLDLDGHTISGGATGIAVTGANVTIANGTVENSGGSGTVGIKLSGTQCALTNLDVVNTYTGFLLQNTAANSISNCRALANKGAGFSLVSSSTNSISNCQAINTTSNSNGYICGFMAQDGAANIFNSCLSQGTSALAANELTSGIYLGNETNSSITNCRVLGTKGRENSFGILLEPDRGIKNSLDLRARSTTTLANGALSVDWLQSSKNYLAVGSAANSHIDIPSMASVFEFTGSTLDTVATITAPLNTVNAVSWRRNGTPHYLATGGIGFVPAPRNALSVYQFSGSTLDYVTSATALAMNPLSVDWFDGTNYLAAGSIATNEVRVYTFTGSSLDLVATVTTPGWDQALSVACLVDGAQKYIAVGGASGSTPTPNIVTRIYAFTGTSIEYLTQITAPATDQVWGVSWLTNNGTHYLATCGLANSQPVNKESIKTYTFNGTTLTPLATPASSGNNWPLSVAWFTDGGTKYLTVGESAGTGATKTELMKVFKQSGATLDLVATYSPGSAGQLLSVASLKSNLSQFLAAGKTTGSYPANSAQQVDVFRFGLGSGDSVGCTVQKNTVTETSDTAASGIGIYADSSANYVAENTSCTNDINYSGVASEYLASQANARGVDNVDCSLTTPDQVAQIVEEAWSIESKADVISSKIDTVIPELQPELWSIESKAEVISSKIDRIVPCAATPIISSGATPSNKTAISGAVTLAESGDYCLSADLSGDIAITGNNITLDLNGYTINGTNNGIDISGTNVDVFNGTIQNAPNTGIGVLLRAPYCSLSSLDVINTKTGYQLINADYNKLSSCRALACTSAGFALENSDYNKLTDCQALNMSNNSNNIAGITSNSGTGNIFTSCLINNVTNTKSTPVADAHGIRLFNEINSQISNCSVDSILSSTYSAYGIRLTTTCTSSPSVIEYSNTDNATAIAWLKKGGTNRYLAVAYQTTTIGIRVFKYDGLSLTQVAQIVMPGADFIPRSVAWTMLNNNMYLAFTTDTGAGNNEIFVYRFIEPNKLYLVDAQNISGGTVDQGLCCSWLELGNTRYLTIGSSVGTVVPTGYIRIYPFNGLYLGSLIISSNPGNTVKSVDWVDTYLATVNSTATNNVVSVYYFNGSTFNPTSPLASQNATGVVNQVKWLKAADGSYYLAIASENGTVYIYKFALPGVVTASAGSLTFVTSFACGSAVKTVSWLPVNSQYNYLAVGGNVVGPFGIKVLNFTGSALGQIYTLPFPLGTVNAVDWFGPYLAIANTSGGDTTVKVYKFGPACLSCLTNNNTVSNVRAGASSGIGYAVSEPNLFINNVGNNNDVDFYPVQNNQNNNNNEF